MGNADTSEMAGELNVAAVCGIHLKLDPRIRTEEFEFKRIMDPSPEWLFFGSGVLVNGGEINPTLPRHCILCNQATIQYSENTDAGGTATFTNGAEEIKVGLKPTSGYRSARIPPHLDYTIIAVDPDDVHKLEGIEPMQLSYEHAVRSKQEVHLCSMNEHGKLSVDQWELASVDVNMLQYVDPGLSNVPGAAVLDKTGQLIGVHFQGFKRTDYRHSMACRVSAIVEDILPWEKKNTDHTIIDR